MQHNYNYSGFYNSANNTYLLSDSILNLCQSLWQPNSYPQKLQNSNLCQRKVHFLFPKVLNNNNKKECIYSLYDPWYKYNAMTENLTKKILLLLTVQVDYIHPYECIVGNNPLSHFISCSVELYSPISSDLIQGTWNYS